MLTRLIAPCADFAPSNSAQSRSDVAFLCAGAQVSCVSCPVKYGAVSNKALSLLICSTSEGLRSRFLS